MTTEIHVRSDPSFPVVGKHAARSARAGPNAFVVGRELGAAGRAVRLVAGGVLIAGGISGAVGGANIPFLALGFAGAAGFYLAIYRALGERVLARASPWVGTLLLVTPLAVRQLAWVPADLGDGVTLYVGVSLLVTVTIAYGGCEVVAIPSLVYGRRYVVYCPFNAVDAAERSLRSRAWRPGHILAVTVAVIAGGWFLLFSPVLGEFGADPQLNPRWALLLLTPAVLLAATALTAWRSTAQRSRAIASDRLLGAGALAYLAITHGGVLPGDQPWAFVMALGLIVALARQIRRRAARPKARRARR